jgi:hypothetical protein
MRLHLLALPLAVLVGCGGAPVDSRDLTRQSFWQAPAPAAETPGGGCEVVFTPAPELRAETLAAAARWSAATGCDIRIGEGGIALRLVEDRMPTPWGTEAHGHTYCPTDDGCKRSALVIDIARDHAAVTVAHEMGHALASTAGHVEDNESALLFHTGGEGAILACDLVLVCAALDCALMTPEA